MFSNNLACLISVALFSNATTSHATVNTDAPLQRVVALYPAPILAKSVNPRFNVAIKALRKKTRVPILIPTRIRENISDPNFYITITSWFSKNDQYYLEFGYSNFAYLSGRKIIIEKESLKQLYEQLQSFNYLSYTDELSWDAKGYRYRSDERVVYVNLSRGIIGVFKPFTCGGICNPSSVYWEQNGYRYAVGMKAGRLSEVVDMANSVIENQP